MLVHADTERQPPEKPSCGWLLGVVLDPETGEQLQFFSIGETRTQLPELQPSDEEFPGDLLGMYFLG